MADAKNTNDAAPPEVRQDDNRPYSPGGPDPKENQVNYAAVDKEVAQYMSDVRIDISPEENKRLLRMIDRRVLSVMVSTYFLQAIDKGTISFASIMGIIQDTNLQGPEYSWLTTCVYIAILFVEYPQNWIITRVPIAKYLSFSILAWGAVLACHAACTSFAGLVVVRTLLGIFEAVCQPAFLVMSSMWYRREEQAARVTYWYMMNGAQQVVGGLLAYCFTLITSGPLRSWQWLFLAYGVLSVAFGAFVGWWLPDSPMRAKCFSEQDKRLMVERVRDNQTGMQNRKFKKEQVFECLRDPQAYAYALIALCTTLPTSGLGAYQGLVIVGFGFNRLEAQLLAMVLGFYILIVLLGSVWIVKRTDQSLLVMLGFVIPSFVGTILIMTLDLTNDLGRRVGLLICYYITLSFWSAQTLSLSMISRNVAGQTKKSVAITMNFLAWSAGNSIGPQVFLTWNKPKYFIAFATHLGCYSLLVLVIISLRFYLTHQNKHRDKLAAEGVREARDANMTRAFDDLTDKENLNFRYMY